MDARFTISLATDADAATLASHRVGMFHDMGAIHPSMEPVLRDAAERYFGAAIPSGEYVAWLAVAADGSRRAIAGAGLQLRPMLPRPDPSGQALLTGLEGLVLGVYVEPAWRRQGVARELMRTLLHWSQARRVARLVLHASDDGRALYESLGFVATNEMRYAGALAER